MSAMALMTSAVNAPYTLFGVGKEASDKRIHTHVDSRKTEQGGRSDIVDDIQEVCHRWSFVIVTREVCENG